MKSRTAYWRAYYAANREKRRAQMREIMKRRYWRLKLEGVQS